MRTRLQDYSRLVPYPIQKKLLSILDGYHQGEGAGSSQEFLDMAEYRPGDDAATIDWKATARRGQPVVKRFESTAVLRVLIVADTGATMATAAPDGSTKKEIAAEIIRALAWLVSSHGDLLGLVAGNSGGTTSMPARAGIGHAETILRVASSAQTSGAPSDLPTLLRQANGSVRRSLIFVITDESRIDTQTVALLRRLSARHEVGLFLVDDFDPTLAEKGESIVDVSGGALPEFVEGNPVIEAQWRMHRRVRGRAVDDLLAPLRVAYARIGSKETVLPALITVLGGSRAS